jgi:hypothetical protein
MVRITARNRESYSFGFSKICYTYLGDISDETEKIFGRDEKSKGQGEQRRETKSYFPIVDSD